jgi:ATP-dependent Zn protease
MNVNQLTHSGVLPVAAADVGETREAARRRRLDAVLAVCLLFLGWLWGSVAAGHLLLVPHLTSGERTMLPLGALVVLVGAVLVVPLLAAGRSPHVRYQPEEIDVSLRDVKGIPVVVEEAVKTLNLFLAHRTFRDQMGGTPRKAMLFEGPPGTGKTHLAKALAREAGVPFLFVSSSAFQSMFYGQTNRKIRSYFGALRSAARREGGAIGFIEEIDAIGATRAGLASGSGREGIAGVVNELLIQLQSFDQPPWGYRVIGGWVSMLNRLLPPNRQLHKPQPRPANVLVFGATNRAADLDPALLRPGRFDRTLSFDLPSRAGRAEILTHALERRAHEPELEQRVDQLAAQTFGYSPAMLVHLLDEGLVWALRRDAALMGWEDIQAARMSEEVGLAQPVEYTEAERRTIATHESGHATMAWLSGGSRRLEVLSIIKRRSALGLLAHSDREERWTRTESELRDLVRIALGGLGAEELFFGERTSGVAADLQYATDLAAQMVGSMGMGGTLVSYAAVQAGPSNLTAKVLSTDEGREAVAGVLQAAREDVARLLQANRHVVEALRDALLDRDELVGDDAILAVIQGAVEANR